MALTGLETYYSFPNIGTNRNTFKWSSDAGATWHEYSLPVGVYELSSIENAIQTELVIKGGSRTGIIIQANKVTLKAILKLESDYRIDFNVENSLKDVLGFEAKIYNQAYVEGKNIVNIFNINTIHVLADCIGGSYVDGANKPIIYSFFLNVKSGEKIVVLPQNLIYLPVHTRYIRTLTVSVTDQDGKLLDLRGEKLSIRFHLKEIELYKWDTMKLLVMCNV